MRHQVSGNRVGRNSSLRKATMRDLTRATLVHQRIRTTKAKAKEARKLVDKMITLGKKNTLAAKRKAFSVLCDHQLVSDLFSKIAVRFKDRVGGYTRIIPLATTRRGDRAQLVFLELTEQEIVVAKKPVSAKAKAAEATLAKSSDKKEEAHPDAKKEAPEAKKEQHIKSEATNLPPERLTPSKDMAKPAKKPMGGFNKIFRKKPAE